MIGTKISKGITHMHFKKVSFTMLLSKSRASDALPNSCHPVSSILAILLIVGLLALVTPQPSYSSTAPTEEIRDERNLAENPLTLSYDVVHTDDLHTVIRMELTEEVNGAKVDNVNYAMNLTKVDGDDPLLASDLFYAENGTLALEITHDESPPEILATKEPYNNAWVADPETGVIPMRLPLEPYSVYLLHVEVLGLDCNRCFLPRDQVPVIDLYLGSDEPIMGQIRMIPEFSYPLMALTSVLMATIIIAGRSNIASRLEHICG